MSSVKAFLKKAGRRIVPLPDPEIVQDENKTEQYTSPVQFVLSLIGCSVGLGNLWKFPYLAYRNGGGAFLIPYFLLYFICGIPIYFLEISIGQFISRGSTKAFHVAPFWKGVGYSMIGLSLCVALFYSSIVSWVIFYLFGSMRSSLVWNKCDNSWNTINCVQRDTIIGSPTFSIKDNVSVTYCGKEAIEGCIQAIPPTVEYYSIRVLKEASSLDQFGTPSWELVLCNLLVWISVACCILYGIGLVGRVVYVTAILPYIILLILLIRSVTLPGSNVGIKYYLQADFDKLKDIKVWYAAGEQVFFSLNLATGNLMMYASYNKFTNNILRDAIIITVVDCLTSFFAGFAVFAIIGYMAISITKSDISEVPAAGPGLAFITYPEVAANLPVGPLWAILFFLMMYTLGIDSLFSMIENLITGIMNLYPRFKKKRPFFVLGVCSTMFLLTIPFACPGVWYLFEAVSSLTATQSFLILGLLEVIIYMYIYGFNNIMLDIKMILQKRPVLLETYLFSTWLIGAPLVIFIVLTLSYLNFELPVVNGKPIPDSIAAFGWALLGLTLFPIPLGMIHEVYRAIKNNEIPNDENTPFYLRVLKYVNLPSKEWRPANNEDCTGRYSSLATLASAIEKKDEETTEL